MKLLMVLLLCLITSLLITSQPANAQHRLYLATKGERVDYDTAVVISYPIYKQELQRQKQKDFLIDSLQQLNLQYADKTQASIMEQQSLETAVDKSITGINENQVRERKRWYRNPIFGLGVGLLIGIYLIPNNGI